MKREKGGCTHLTTKPLMVVGLSFYNDVNSLERCLDSIVLNLPMRYVKVLALDGKYLGYQDKSDLSTDGSRELVQHYIDKYGKDKIELYDYPNLHERFKRQKYVDIAAELGAKFLLILDSDEYVECKNPPDLLDELKHIDAEWQRREDVINDNTPPQPNGKDKMPRVGNVHSIKFIDLDDKGYVTNAAARPRLWYHPEDMQYFGKHYHFGPKRILNDPNYHQNTINNNNWTRPNSRVGMALQEAATHKSYIINNVQVWHSHDMRSEEREQKRYLYETNKLPKLEKP